MCFQTALSFRQRCERPVTIQLHVRKVGNSFQTFSHAPSPASLRLPEEPRSNLPQKSQTIGILPVIVPSACRSHRT